jgi:hypothetical protein
VVQAVAGANDGTFLYLGGSLFDVVHKRGIPVEVRAHEEKLVSAFRIASGGAFPQEMMRAIEEHRTGLYLIAPGGTLETARAAMLGTAALLRAGGVAAKVDSSGRAQSRDNWLALAGYEGPQALYEGFVCLVGDRTQLYTCGMHLLGLPDALLEGRYSPGEARSLLDAFLLYVLIESPSLATGHTFSVRAGAPRYRLRQVPDRIHPGDDLFHNPFGFWQLSPV